MYTGSGSMMAEAIHPLAQPLHLNAHFQWRLQLVDATLYLYNKKMECRKWYTEHE